MSWATPTADLRTLLSDGATDRYRYRKRVFGELNGTNVMFKTFEFRRVTDFTTAATPLGVYLNGVRLLPAAIASDYPNTGEFTLVTAPIDGDVIECSYYVQWFLDSELTDFVVKATNWLGLGSIPANVPDGLIPAAMKFASAEAYLKMAMRWREHLSDTYRVEDSPKEGTTVGDEYIKMSELFRKEATQNRDEYYRRQGQPLQPLWGVVVGNVPNTTPRG
jgi:hypothetical protein